MVSITRDLKWCQVGAMGPQHELSLIGCIGYLLLHNILTQHVASQNNNKYLLSHIVSVGQGTGSSLAGWPWHGVSHEVTVKMSTRAAVI